MDGDAVPTYGNPTSYYDGTVTQLSLGERLEAYTVPHT